MGFLPIHQYFNSFLSNIQDLCRKFINFVTFYCSADKWTFFLCILQKTAQKYDSFQKENRVKRRFFAKKTAFIPKILQLSQTIDFLFAMCYTENRLGLYEIFPQEAL